MVECIAALKLNLGCGKRHFPDYVNIDFPENYSGKKPDLECDIRSLPYRDETIDEIIAVHVFEHFYVWEAEDILKEWARVLKKGGKLILELPCLDKVIGFLNENPLRLRYTLLPLYGDPAYKNPHMVHKWCYPKGQLKALMARQFREVAEEPVQFHFPERDMRMVGIK